MNKIASADGTVIAYERLGAKDFARGPVIVVAGLCVIAHERAGSATPSRTMWQ